MYSRPFPVRSDRSPNENQQPAWIASQRRTAESLNQWRMQMHLSRQPVARRISSTVREARTEWTVSTLGIPGSDDSAAAEQMRLNVSSCSSQVSREACFSMKSRPLSPI